MAAVEIVIPVSRADHLVPLFTSLEALDCDPEQTSLLAYVDGNKALYEAVAQLTDNSKFAIKRCIHRPGEAAFGIPERRRRIAAIHNELTDLIGPCDYIFGLEDDTIAPSHALKDLVADYDLYPHAGLIEGVEVGRWSIPYIGAWRADDVYQPTEISTIEPAYEIQEIDAGGFYCFLSKREYYVKHEFKTWERNTLGPDVNYGLSLRREGYKNYVDFRVRCKHLQGDGKALTLTGQLAKVTVRRVKRGKIELWRQSIERL